jgi:hypothetical protein
MNEILIQINLQHLHCRSALDDGDNAAWDLNMIQCVFCLDF